MKEEIKRINFGTLFRVVGYFSFLFLIFYLLFALFYKPIHNFYPEVDPNSITIWLRIYIVREGIELPVMVFGLCVYLLASYFVISKNFKVFGIFNSGFLQLLCGLSVAVILLRIRSYVFTFFEGVFVNLAVFIFGSACIFALIYFLKILEGKKVLRVLALCSGLFFVLFVILALPPASVYDYSFLLGPALKISQGEHLGSFYLQYGLLETYLFKLFIALGMKLAQMQIILALSLVSWFGLYFILAGRLIKDKILLFLLIVSLVVLRYLAILIDPTFIPAVLPLRLDLWVILALIVLRFGFNSIITASGVALLYVFDDTFGLFYLCLYLLFAIFYVLKNFKLQKLLLFCPILLALIWHFAIFGSITNPGAKLYQSAHIVFSPISLNSPFWIILAASPYFLWVIAKETNSKLKIYYFFLVGIAFCQLIYFFGRSNDNNLPHLSAIFLLLSFVAFNLLSQKYKLTKIVTFLACLFLILSTVLFSGDIVTKVSRAVNSTINLKLDNAALEETFVDKNPNLFDGLDKSRLLILSALDSYYNYRYGVKQLGYFVPFSIHVYVDETAAFLIGKINEGFRLVFWEDETAQFIEQLNHSDKMKVLGLQFEANERGNLFEVNLVKSKVELLKSYNLDDKATFDYPQTWRLSKSQDGKKIRLADFSGQLNIGLEFKGVGKNLNADEYLSLSSLGFIDLSREKSINILGAEKIYVRDRQEDGVEKVQILAFSGSKDVLEIEVFPANVGHILPRYLRIINTIKFK